jgi:hypothetical protein
MRRLLAAIAVLAACSAATTGTADATSCSRALASAAVKQVKPHIPSLGDAPLLVTPAMVDELICFDFTGDGRVDLAMTVASGGTAGDVGWLVLQRTASGWRLAIGRNGYKLGLFRVGRDVVASQPIYRKNDPNCCPTGGFAHERWRWNGNGGRFVLVRSWKSKSFKP